MNKLNEQFLNKQQIQKYFNTTKIVQIGNLIQVQHYATGIYHYLVKNSYGWNELGITSIRPDFFNQLVEGE